MAIAALGCSDDDPVRNANCSACTSDAGDSGSIPDSAVDASIPDSATDGTVDALAETGADAASDCLKQASGVGVAEADLDGYPPYSVDGCSMAYVSSAGDLLLRDLTTGSEESVALAAEAPRRPTLSAGVLAWEAAMAGKTVVRLRTAGANLSLSGSFDHAREPRASADAVVFTGFYGTTDTSDSDVFLYDLASKTVSALQTAKGQQRFADVSATHVAWSDFSEDPSGVYSGDGTSLADIVLYDRGTKKLQSIALGGKQAFPMLAVAGSLGFLDWLAVHPVPKLQDYRIMALPLADLSAKPKLVASVQSEVAVRPSANATRVEWVVRWSGKSTLHRAPLDGSAAPVEVGLGAVAEVHAPVGTTGLSVVATRSAPGAPPTLKAFAAP